MYVKLNNAWIPLIKTVPVQWLWCKHKTEQHFLLLRGMSPNAAALSDGQSTMHTFRRAHNWDQTREEVGLVSRAKEGAGCLGSIRRKIKMCPVKAVMLLKRWLERC